MCKGESTQGRSHSFSTVSAEVRSATLKERRRSHSLDSAHLTDTSSSLSTDSLTSLDSRSSAAASNDQAHSAQTAAPTPEGLSFELSERQQTPEATDKRHTLHYLAKHGSEVSFALASSTYFWDVTTPLAVTSTEISSGLIGLMYYDAFIAILEAQRLWQIDDHHSFENKVKSLLNALNGLQLATCAYNPAMAAFSAPLSFSIGVLCEAGLTFLERQRAKKECDFQHWLTDQSQAVDYYDKKISEFEQSEHFKADNLRYLQRVRRRNAILLDIEARLQVAKDPRITQRQQEVSEWLKEKTVHPAGFNDWLKEKITELQQADVFLYQRGDQASEEQIDRRNHLLHTIERSCQLFLAKDKLDQTKQTEALTSVKNIKHPFYIDQKLAKTVDASWVQQGFTLHSTPTAAQQKRAQQIQQQAEDLYHLQQELLRIKLTTFISMSLFTLSGIVVATALPPAALPIALVTMVACYHFYKNGQKATQVMQEKMTKTPPALRNDQPIPAISTQICKLLPRFGWPSLTALKADSARPSTGPPH